MGRRGRVDRRRAVRRRVGRRRVARTQFIKTCLNSSVQDFGKYIFEDGVHVEVDVVWSLTSGLLNVFMYLAGSTFGQEM